MGNISNLWYIKGQGGSWADTKCELDDCYSIPYAIDNPMWLQADIPGGHTANEVWICDAAGNRLRQILTGGSHATMSNRLMFRVDEESGACQPVDVVTGTICTIIVDDLLSDPYGEGILENYKAGLENTTFTINIGSNTFVDIDGALPTGFAKISNDPLRVQVPCDYDNGTENFGVFYSNVGNKTLGNSAYDAIENYEVTTPGPNLTCFYFEIPLIKSGVEVAALASEPFHCPECEQTLLISSDYCLQPTDIFGEFTFNDGLGVTNLMRIQAVLKRMPSKTTFNANTRCHVFKPKVQEQFKLQGAFPTDFPDYMVRVIESIFLGKNFFINGEQYQRAADQVFIERNVAGRSMKKLDVALTKCESGLVFPCSCTVDCTNGEPDHPFTLVIVPEIFPEIPPSGDYNGLDRTFYRANVSASGAYGPYSFSGWETNGQTEFNDDIEVFDDSRDYNYVRRKSDHLMGYNSLDPEGNPYLEGIGMRVRVTDSRGCSWYAGLSIDAEDMRCAGFNASFQGSNITPGFTGHIILFNILPAGYTSYDIYTSANLSLPAYVTGVTTDPYEITGLVTGQDYAIVLKVYCEDGVHGFIGPLFIKAS